MPSSQPKQSHTPAPPTTQTQTAIAARPFAQQTKQSPNSQQDQYHLSPSCDRKCQVTHSLSTIGIGASPSINPQPIQAKLEIGSPNDKYEQEADRVADQVVNRIQASSAHPLQRADVPEEEDLQMKSLVDSIQRMDVPEEDDLQMKPLVQRQSEAMDASPSVEQAIEQARGKGRPLDETVRQPMEQAFGADFSGVRVHTGGQSDQLNRSIQARAFTTGQDVFFRQGEYQPNGRTGQELLAHELTHVVQQNPNTAARKSISMSANKDSHNIQRRMDVYDARPLHQSSSYLGRYKVGRGIGNLANLENFQHDDTEPQELLLYHKWSDASKNYPEYSGNPADHTDTPMGGFKRAPNGESVACFWYGTRVADAEEPTWKTPSRKAAWVDYDHQPGVKDESTQGYMPDPSLADGHFHKQGADREATIPDLYGTKLGASGV